MVCLCLYCWGKVNLGVFLSSGRSLSLQGQDFMGLFSTSGDADKKPFLHHLPHPQKHCYELKLRNNQFHPACSHADHFVQVLELLLKLTHKYEPAEASKHRRKSHGARNQKQYSKYIGFESVFAFTIWQSLPNLKYWSRLHLPKLELHSSLIR